MTGEYTVSAHAMTAGGFAAGAPIASKHCRVTTGDWHAHPYDWSWPMLLKNSVPAASLFRLQSIESDKSPVGSFRRATQR